MTAVVVHGDCAEVLRPMEGAVNLIVTSPPYDNLREYGGGEFDFDSVADACANALVPGGVMVWVIRDATSNGSETGTSFRHALGFMERGLYLHDTMIYGRAHPGNVSKGRYSNAFEYMFVFSKGPPATANLIEDRKNATGGRVRNTQHRQGRNGDEFPDGNYRPHVRAEYGRRTNVWRFAAGLGSSAPDFRDAHNHPAVFPYALARDHIHTWTNLGDLVVDPMCGSGTVLVAATLLGRNAIGVDIHDEYCELARERLANIPNLSEEVLTKMTMPAVGQENES